MRFLRSTSRSFAVFFSLLVSYLLLISLFAPFGIRRVEAAVTEKPIARKVSGSAPTSVHTKANQQQSGWREGEILIRFRQGVPASKMNALLRANGAQWNGPLRGQSRIERLRLAEGSDPEAIAAALRTSELVDFVEPNYLITADQTPSSTTPDDPRVSEQWALTNTRASQGWRTTTGTKQTVIAVIDSGIDFKHPDLENNQWENTLEQANNLDDDGNDFNDDLNGWDFVTNSAGAIDEQGHGTAVAGIIAAQGNNATGITGVMWRASLMNLRVLDNSGTGDIARAVEAIDYAVTNGAQVINCSWGTDENSVALREAINRAAQRGVVVISSAGNSSRDIETTPHYPASFELPNLISVASTDNYDVLAPFSNWGMAHVSIAAPGKDILTTKFGGDYETISGSSASTALVTGVAGLIKTLRPWLSADRTKEMILRGARQVPALSDKVASRGIVSATGALESLNTLSPTEGLDEHGGNNGGEHGNSGNGRSSQRNDGQGVGNGQRDGREFRVTPPERTQGAPGSGLPNLDQLRNKQPTTPQAAPPVPSTRCSHRDPDCVGRRAANDASTDLLAWGSNSRESLPGELPGEDSRAISDTPFKLGWVPGLLLAAPMPEPQSTRTNVALTTNGGLASAPSQLGSGFLPAGANNDDHKGLNWGNGGGWADGTANSFPDWLEVSFNSNKLIDEIDVFGVQDNYQSPIEPTETMTFSLYGLTSFQVQYWNGTSWADVPGGNVTGNNLVWRKFTFSPITTSKIRVLVNNAPNGHSRIVEVEAYGTDVPTNVALAANGGVASAPSQLGSGFLPAGANNGDSKGLNWGNGGGWADGTANSFPDSLEVSFNSSKTIDEIDVFGLQDNYQSPVEPTETMTFSLYGLTSFQVQYWSGTSWAAVPGGNVTGNNLVWRKFTFSPITTSKIRVLVNNAPNGHSRIVEVEAYGLTAGAGTTDYNSSRLDPLNRTGSGGVDLLSRNANWSLPILGLKGRAGLDLGLSLSYNSLVWTKSQDGASIKFDADQGSPGPGFRLGFPVIQARYYNSQVEKHAYTLITPAGARVELRQVGTSNVYESADSSYLQFDSTSLILRPTDGSQLFYELRNGQYLCTQIKDRNGNYISINHHADGRINTITDTLARVVTFNYDTYLNLTSIVQNRGGVTYQWATFGWSNLTIQTSFASNLTVIGPQNNSSIPVLTQVSFADGSRYNFEYNSYAQVSVIRHHAQDNHQLSYTTYTHTLPNGSGDCPRVTETRDWAEYWNGDTNGVPTTTEEAVSVYLTAGDYSSGQVTMPDGTIYKELFATTGWQKGLTTGTEIWSASVKKKWTTTTFTQSDTNLPYQQNPRVTETNVYDQEGNRRRTVIDYGSYVQWNLPYRVIEYAANGTTAIRETFTDYNLSQAYLDKHIIGLVSAVHVSDGAWRSKTGYEYDAGGDQLQATTPTTTPHDASYDTQFTTRGNLTKVSRYDVSDIGNESKKLATKIGYNTNGSVIFMRDPLDHQTNISYAESFSDGNNTRNTFAYPTEVTPPTGSGETPADFASNTQYDFYSGAVTRTQGPKPTVHSQGAIQTFEYDAAGRISRVNNVNNGAYQRWVHDPAGHISVHGIVQTGGQETFSTTVFDGAGRVRGTSAENPNSPAGGYRGQLTHYDVMGRVMEQSNPTEMTLSWVAAGDDAAGWVWTQQAYDWKGRPTTTTSPDGTTKLAEYGGCGCAGGEVVTLRDEVGRKQQMTADILGRPLKKEVLRWTGTEYVLYSSVTNNYNARDQVTSVVEAGASGPSQTTAMTYDGYGRLKTRQAPSQTAATQFAYNADDTSQTMTDGRGVVTSFSYNNRHQTTGITYGVPEGIVDSADVTFSYDAAGNRTSMTDGSGSVTYQYDQLSRLTSESRQFSGPGPSSTYTLSYSYNLANELTSITDPGNAVINYAYDKTGRMTDVTGSSFAGVTEYATTIRFRAWGGVKSTTYGDSSSLTAGYNSRLLPTSFAVTGPSVSLSKNYQYNDDGRLRYSQHVGLGKFDRSYTYDHVGRVTEAFSGPLARGEADTDVRPYKMYYDYDAMNHLTSRDGRLWSGPGPGEVGSYVNDKNIYSQYDADGRLTSGDETQYSFDAAGRAVGVTGEGGDLTQLQVFDGAGVRTKLFSQRVTLNEDETTTTDAKTQYFVTSSVTGRVVTELDETGQKTRTFVYQGSQVLAWQQKNGSTETIAWEHRDLSNASVRGTASAELDPLGVNAGLMNPFPIPSTRPPLTEARTYPGFADMQFGSQCIVDGIEQRCGSSGGTVQCPDNICSGYNINTNRFETYHAYSDRHQGYMAANATYLGNGEVWTPDNSSNLINTHLVGTQDSSVTVGGVHSLLAHSNASALPQNPEPSQPNPNCITNAVEGGTLGTTRGLIPAISAASGRPVPTGRAAHDGIHVYAPPGDPAAVTALPAMAGRILHSGRQATSGADYNLALVDILLNARINGQQYVMTLKDLNYRSSQLSGTIRPGSVIGSVDGSADMVGESGLHVTLMPYSTYQRNIGGRPSAAARNRVPFNSLMDAARNPASPFRCP